MVSVVIKISDVVILELFILIVVEFIPQALREFKPRMFYIMNTTHILSFTTLLIMVVVSKDAPFTTMADYISTITNMPVVVVAFVSVIFSSILYISHFMMFTFGIP